MKKLFNKISRRPIVWLLLLLIIIYLPAAVIAPAENDRVAIASTLGLDYEDEKFIISALILVPSKEVGFSENYELVSSDGGTVGEAISAMEVHIGKNLGLIHVGTIVVSEELLERDLLKNALDPLIRTNNMGKNTTIVACNNTAKELLFKARKLGYSTGSDLNNIVFYNEQYVFATQTNIDAFYKGYFSPTKTSMISVVEQLKAGEDEGITAGQQTASSPGAQSGVSESGEDKKSKESIISNAGKALILKNGKTALKIEGEMLKRLNAINPRSKFGTIKIEGVTDDNFNNADIVFELKNKKVKVSAGFVDSKPFINYDVMLSLDLLEAYQEDKNIKTMFVDKNIMTEELKNKISYTVKKEFSIGLNLLKENNLDAINAYDILIRREQKKFRDYLKTHGEDNYFRNIIFTMTVKTIVKT